MPNTNAGILHPWIVQELSKSRRGTGFDQIATRLRKNLQHFCIVFANMIRTLALGLQMQVKRNLFTPLAATGDIATLRFLFAKNRDFERYRFIDSYNLRVSTSSQIGIGILFVVGYATAPISLVWGWVQWIRRPKLWSGSPIFSLIGLILASVSGLLALSTIAYAQVHRFPFYDPLLLRIFRIGALLSLGGLGFGIAGIWRPSSLRWHAAVSSFGMLIFWIVAASGE